MSLCVPCRKLLSQKGTKRRKCFENHVLWILDWVLCLGLVHWLQNVEANSLATFESGLKSDNQIDFVVWTKPGKDFFRRHNIRILSSEHDHTNRLFSWQWVTSYTSLVTIWSTFEEISTSMCQMWESNALKDFLCCYLLCTVHLHLNMTPKLAPSF